MSTTVSVQVAVTPVSTLVAVMTTLPAATDVTRPFASTFATFSSEELQVMAWFAALDGRTLPVSWKGSRAAAAV